MNQLTRIYSARTPALITAAGDRAAYRFLEFFAANIRNPHTCRAYSRAVGEFLAWCAAAGLPSITDVAPLHVAAWIEGQVEAGLPRRASSSAWRCCGICSIGWWSGRSCRPTPPPRCGGRRISSKAARRRCSTRPRPAPCSIASTLRVRLREKGGKAHAMPCHHNLETYLHAYIDGCGLADVPKALLFQTIPNRGGQLTGTPLPQANAYQMIRRRATKAGIDTKVGNHTFRATGITAYLKNGGVLEKAASMANHASTRTTQLYDRRRDDMSLDEVEKIGI